MQARKPQEAQEEPRRQEGPRRPAQEAPELATSILLVFLLFQRPKVRQGSLRPNKNSEFCSKTSILLGFLLFQHPKLRQGSMWHKEIVTFARVFDTCNGVSSTGVVVFCVDERNARTFDGFMPQPGACVLLESSVGVYNVF